jgi:hypothetical protein
MTQNPFPEVIIALFELAFLGKFIKYNMSEAPTVSALSSFFVPWV